MKISKTTNWECSIPGGNYQMQIVTKLPNENIQNYQLGMFNFVGGGELPNANCYLVTKLPNENIQNYQLGMFDSGGGNYQIQTVTKLTNENIQNYQLGMFDLGRGETTKRKLLPNYQMKISKTTN